MDAASATIRCFCFSLVVQLLIVFSINFKQSNTCEAPARLREAGRRFGGLIAMSGFGSKRTSGGAFSIFDADQISRIGAAIGFQSARVRGKYPAAR